MRNTTFVKEDPVEVKIGVQHAPRELTLESPQTPAEVEQAVTDALAKDTVLTLTDEKGRRVIVPVAKIAYIEIAESSNRPFGFTTR
jgi:hypothetical protein